MKIASVNYGQQQNFRGILIKTNNTVLNERTDGKNITTRKEEYRYFPFADEPIEEMEKIRKKYNKYHVHYCLPATYNIIKKTVQIDERLHITKAQYEKLKPELDDDLIIQVFA